MPHSQPKRPWIGWQPRMRVSLAVMLLASIMGLALASTDIGMGVEHGLQTVRDTVRQHDGSGRYVLVEIDARSLDKVDRWPWPRGLYGKAIAALERAGAETIAFDVDFSAYSNPDQDAAFAQAIERAKVPVVLPTFRQFATSSRKELVENLPIAPLRAHAQLAAVNIGADSDGLVRRYPYGVATGGVPRPSIGAMLADATGKVGEAFPVDGAIRPDSVPRISFVDLLQGKVRPGALKGKSVLIGATAIELGDRYSVPRHGVIPGPLIQLLAADTLYLGTSPVDHGPVAPLVVAMLVLGLALRVRIGARLVLVGGCFAAVLGWPLAMEYAHLGTVDVLPALAALMTGAIATSVGGMLVAIQTARHVDQATGLPNRHGFRRAAQRDAIGSVSVLRIANYSDAASVVGQQHAAQMIGRLIERLKVAGIKSLYRLEESVIAWTADPDAVQAGIDQLDGLAGLLRAPVEVAGRQIDLNWRMGIAIDHGGTDDADTLADRAITAADHALEKGSRWEIHSAELGEAQDWRLTLASQLDEAMAKGDVWVAYQPKLDIASGRIMAAEALVRWRHPVRGPISPDAFIPALEASGRILDLTIFVLQRAARDAAAWHAAGTPINVAINVSAMMTTDEAFLAAVDDLLEQGVVTPDMLTLEVTESAAMADPEYAVAALERIAERGIKISIDDYGTGQSTLTYLKRLPAREIKIDKSFILGLETNRGDQAMVRSTIELAHELGYSVVAEGVETAAMLDKLTDMGCDTAQGWHVGKPVPAGAFTDMIAPVRKAA